MTRGAALLRAGSLATAVVAVALLVVMARGGAVALRAEAARGT